MKRAGPEMKLEQYDGKHVRVTVDTGETFTGIANYCVPEFCLHEYGNEEAAVKIGEYLIYESEIVSVEETEEF